MVDDQEFNLNVLQNILAFNYQIKTTCCISAKVAVELYKVRLMSQCCDRFYKLVLTDIQMPNMDGV